MPVTAGASGNAGNSSGGAIPSLAVTTGAQTAGSALIAMIAFFSFNGTGPAVSVSDTSNGTYTQVGSALIDTNNDSFIYFFKRENIAAAASSANTITVTFTGAGGNTAVFGAMTVQECKGAASSGSVDLIKTGTGNSASASTTGSTTTAQGGEMALSACLADNNTSSGGSGYTAIGTNPDPNCGAWWQFETGISGSANQQATNGVNSGEWIIMMITVQPPGGGAAALDDGGLADIPSPPLEALPPLDLFSAPEDLGTGAKAFLEDGCQPWLTAPTDPPPLFRPGALEEVPQAAVTVALDEGGLLTAAAPTVDPPDWPWQGEDFAGARPLDEQAGAPATATDVVAGLALYAGEELANLPVEEQNAAPVVATDFAPPPLQLAEEFPGGPFPFEERSALPQVASDAAPAPPQYPEEFPGGPFPFEEPSPLPQAASDGAPTPLSYGENFPGSLPLEDLALAPRVPPVEPLELLAVAGEELASAVVAALAADETPLVLLGAGDAAPLLPPIVAEDFAGAPLHIDDPAPLPPPVATDAAPPPPQYPQEYPPPATGFAGLEELPAALGAPLEAPAPIVRLGVEETVSLPLEEQSASLPPVAPEWPARPPLGDQEATSPVLFEDGVELPVVAQELAGAPAVAPEDAAPPVALEETGGPLPRPPETSWLGLLTMPAEELPGRPFATDDGAGLLWWVPFDPQYAPVPIGADEQILVVELGPIRALLSDAPIIGVTTTDVPIIEVTLASYP